MAISADSDLYDEEDDVRTPMNSRGSICGIADKKLFFVDQRGATLRRVEGTLSRRNLTSSRNL